MKRTKISTLTALSNMMQSARTVQESGASEAEIVAAIRLLSTANQPLVNYTLWGFARMVERTSR